MIYLMRHGQDDENYIGGWSDGLLTNEGVDGVIKTALWIKDNLEIKQIICSDIKRARQTAMIVNKYLNVPIIYSDLLREQNKGKLNGLLKEDVKRTSYKIYLKKVNIDTVFPDGESLESLYERVKSNINYFMQLNDDTLIITHRGVINMFYYILRNVPLDMDKKKFKVEVASVHALNKITKNIKRIK